MRPKTQASFGPYTAWYVAAVAGIWACAAIVPGAGLFRYSWRLETDKLQLLEEKQARQHQRDWTTRDEKLQQNKRIADREAFLKDRQRHFGSYQVALAETGSSSWDRWLERNLPLYNDVAQQLRYQGSSGSRGQLGSIVKGYKNAGVGLGWTAFFGGAAIVLIAWWWLRYKVRHLFWSHLYGRQAAKDPVELARKHPFVILLIPLQQEKRVVAARTAAAMAAAVGAAVARTSGSGPREPLVVDDFDGAFFEPHRRIELLERLEDAVGQDGRAIIVSPLDPFQLLSQAGRHGDLPDDQAVPAPEKERWFRVLEQFRLHVVTVGRTAIPDPAAQDPPSAFAKMRIHEGHFRSLWRYCSQHERLTLIQVAEEGFANPLQVGALKRLVEKGLIVLRPNIMLMDPAFEEFVLQMAASPEVKTWEQPEGSLGWRGSRWILAAALLGGVVILASTQESWIRSATGLLTVVAGGMEAVWQLLRAVQRSRAPTG
jgi:hypothetical protein